MIRIPPKCPMCKKSMRQPLITDQTEDNFTQFYITYCPNCVGLGDEVKAKVWAKTIKNTKQLKEKGYDVNKIINTKSMEVKSNGR